MRLARLPPDMSNREMSERVRASVEYYRKLTRHYVQTSAPPNQVCISRTESQRRFRSPKNLFRPQGGNLSRDQRQSANNCTYVREVLTEDCLLQVFQLGSDVFLERFEDNRNLVSNQFPLVVQFHVHFPNDFGIPIHSPTLHCLVVTIVLAPGIILSCIERVSVSYH